MSELQDGSLERGRGWAGRAVAALARWSAFAAGAILVGLVAIVIASVVGRALVPLGLTSIRGDYELVSAGVASAAFLSLGWAHLQSNHAAVGLLVDRFGPRSQRWVGAIVHVTVALAAAFLAWRLAAGMVDRLTYGDTSQLLRLPLAWPYGAAALGAMVLAIVAGWQAVASARALPAPVSGSER